MSSINFILSLARKLLARESKGITTIPNRMAVEQKAGEIAATLQRGGVPLERADEIIRSEQDLVRILNLIESTPPVMREVPSGIRSTKSAKIMDMEGKEIDPRSKIMGGKQLETEAEIAERLQKENKEGIARIRAGQKMLDDAIDDASPGFSGDRKVDAELVAENLAERMGKVYDDLPTKERLKLYDEAYTGLSKRRAARREADADSQESSYDDGPADFDPDADNETFAQGGRAGFFLGSANPRGLGLLRQILKYMSKTGKELDKFQGVDLSALDMLRFSNPKRFNKLLEDVRGKVNVKEGIMGTDSVKAMQQADREKRKGITAGALEVAKDMKARDIKIKRRIAEEAENTIIPQMKKQLMEGMGMSEEAAEEAARGMAEAAQNMRLTDDPPIITKEGILQLENVLKNMETGGKKARDLNADGGRIGFKDGMTRRTFLKLLGGLATIPIVGKIIKPIKLATGVKEVPIIKTDNVPGKPEWFDALVNKVIIEGDDVTKKFATKEREIVHAKQIDEDNYVTVTQDLDEGVVRVEYESPTTMFGDKVDMAYVKPLPDEGNPRPVGEFQTSESGIVGRAQGPDDYDLEIEGMSGRAIEDLESDVSKLKEYATGKKLTMKEIVEAKKRKDKVRYYESPEGQSQYVTERQGEADDYYTDIDDFASGGIARMLGE